MVSPAYWRDYFEFKKREEIEWRRGGERIIAVLHQWHIALEDGYANLKQPKLDGSATQEQADRLVELLDRFSRREWVLHEPAHRHMGAEAPWEFAKLESHARLAMAEEIKEALSKEVKDARDDAG